MSFETDVLRALLRLARRPTAPTLEQLSVGGDDQAVEGALRALAQKGLVQRTPAGLRLSMEGLAVAVAVTKQHTTATPKPQTTRKPARRTERRAA